MAKRAKIQKCSLEFKLCVILDMRNNLIAGKPFEKLSIDVTEFSVCNEKVYLCPHNGFI